VLALFLQHSSKLASIVKAATSSVKTTSRSPSKALPADGIVNTYLGTSLPRSETIAFPERGWKRR
jgi:hypothetical protein